MDEDTKDKIARIRRRAKLRTNYKTWGKFSEEYTDKELAEHLSFDTVDGTIESIIASQEGWEESNEV